MKFGKAFILLLIVAIVVWWGVCRPYTVPMGGMEPALNRGDKVLVLNRWCDRSLEVGDMVLYDALIVDSGETNVRYMEQSIARVAALPGDTIRVAAGNMIAGADGRIIPYARELYSYASRLEDRVSEIIDKYQWGFNDLYGYEGDRFIRSFTKDEAYFLSRSIAGGLDLKPLREDVPVEYAEVVVPKRGLEIEVTEGNMVLLRDALIRYENCAAEIIDGKLLVNGRKAGKLIFGRDYYWVKSENVIDLYDSRKVGFVPENSISGRLTLLFFSSKPDGTFCWNRLFRTVE